MEETKINKKWLLEQSDYEVLRKQGINKVVVKYKSKFLKRKEIKIFSVENWVALKNGIIENLYNKDLCEIKFLR